MTTSPLRRTHAAPATEMHDGATEMFAALMTSGPSACTDPDRIPTAGERTLAQIDAAWDRARVVSFDVFDTLIVRKVASPRDVFLHLAAARSLSSWDRDAFALAQHRQEAENDARRRGFAHRASAEVTLHEIHSVLAERLHRPGTDVADMVEAERQIERALCVAHPYLQTVFARAVREQKVIWCVSDTYHEAHFLRDLLVHCGFDLTNVAVVSSADQRASKGEGKLLKQLAAAAQVAPREVLHIGDHPTADGSIPERQGFVSVCHPWAASRQSDRPATSAGDSIALGLSQIGSRAVEPAFPFWFRFGYSVAGPMLSGFALWLHQKFAADGIARAYFLLRDGEIILDVYRALLGDRSGPTTALLESSRRAYMMPALASGLGSIMSQLSACENPRPAREFLERVGLRSNDFRAAFRAAELDPDEIIAPENVASMTKVLTLLGRLDVVHALLARSQVERQLLTRYLRQEGVLDTGRIALVDIGWNGTIQKALAASAVLEQLPLDMHGYYLGTLPPIAHELNGSTTAGFLFDCGTPSTHTNAVLELRQLVEFICTTTRGSLRGFRADGERVLPVHGTVDHPEVQRAHVAQLREGALAFARSVSQEQRVFGESALSAEAAIRGLARTITEPTAEEARCIGDILHGDGLGSDRARTLATFSDGPITAESLRRDYAAAYWPRGLVTRQEPAALALRGLLWLHGA